MGTCHKAPGGWCDRPQCVTQGCKREQRPSKDQVSQAPEPTSYVVEGNSYRELIAQRDAYKSVATDLARQLRERTPADTSAPPERAGHEPPAEPGGTFPPCMRPPKGWVCTRDPSHEGPCAAHPVENGIAAEQIEQLKAALRDSNRAYIRVVRERATFRAKAQRLEEERAAQPPRTDHACWSLVDEYLQSHNLNNNDRGILRRFAGWADTGRSSPTKGEG
jgi:hypothetical protein